jgi:hypothetical protein
MEDSFQYKIIETFYDEAVKGILANKLILSNFDLWNKYYLELPEKEQVVYTVVLFDWQVNNGGFHQYFLNPYGVFCYYTVENLVKIKCAKQADLLERAISVIYDQTHQKGEFLRKIFNRKLESVNGFDGPVLEELSLLDNKYYEIAEDDVNNKLRDYLNE